MVELYYSRRTTSGSGSGSPGARGGSWGLPRAGRPGSTWGTRHSVMNSCTRCKLLSSCRRRGVDQPLILDQALGGRPAQLWVAKGNARARRFYDLTDSRPTRTARRSGPRRTGRDTHGAMRAGQIPTVPISVIVRRRRKWLRPIAATGCWPPHPQQVHDSPPVVAGGVRPRLVPCDFKTATVLEVRLYAACQATRWRRRSSLSSQLGGRECRRGSGGGDRLGWC